MSDMNFARIDSLFKEVKFVQAGSQTGEFEGYAAVFGNVDSHGDIIRAGAFEESLSNRKAAGRSLPPMYKMHGSVTGNHHEPIGVWDEMKDDGRGLYVKGRIIGLDTEQGRWNYAQLKEGALGGLSIGYRVPSGGALPGSGKAKRIITKAELLEVSLVDQPSNAQAQVYNVKTMADRSRLVAGYATMYNKIHFGDRSQLEVFSPGCFARTLVSGKAVRAIIEHDEAKVVGTTADVLELRSDRNGLGFKCFLPYTPEGSVAYDMVNQAVRCSMSVSYEVRVDEVRNIDGHDIRFIRDAELNEISFVKAGAVREAFAVKHSSDDMLDHIMRNGSLLSDGAAAGFKRAFHKFEDDVLAMVRR